MYQEAESAERMADLVSYASDKAWLKAKADELRARAGRIVERAEPVMVERPGMRHIAGRRVAQLAKIFYGR